MSEAPKSSSDSTEDVVDATKGKEEENKEDVAMNGNSKTKVKKSKDKSKQKSRRSRSRSRSSSNSSDASSRSGSRSRSRSKSKSKTASKSPSKSPSRSKSKSKSKSPSKSRSRSRSVSRSRSRSRSDSRRRSSRRRKRSRRSRRSPSSSYDSSRSPSRGRRSKRRSRRNRRSYSRSRSYSYSRSRSRGRSMTPPYMRKPYYGGRQYPPIPPPRRGSRWTREDREAPPPSRVLGCFGLSQRTTDRELRNIFEKFGRIEKVMLIIDRKTGISKGFGFVYFEHERDATEAKRQCAGMELDGRLIRIDYSLTRRPHSPTPGTYLGRRPAPRRRRSRSRSRSYSYSRSRSDSR